MSDLTEKGIHVFSLINSEAVRNHLRKTGKEFSPLETAWLIRHNRYMWLEKKCRAWEELIRTVPDCEVPERRNCAYFPSLHGMLRDYIALCKDLTERLRKKEAGTVYELTGHEDGLGWWRNPALYPSYEDCVQAAEESCDGAVNAIRIRKLRPGTGEQIMALFDNTLHLKEIDAAGLPAEEDKLLHGTFDGMWFDFPMPFSRGDILWDPDPVSGTGPFVLTSAGVSGAGTESARREMIRNGDGTDMAAWGVFQGEDGSLYNDVYYNWMDLEYYPGPYEREERALKALSDLRKGRIDEVAFAAVCHAVMMQNLAETAEAESLCTGHGTGVSV